MPPIAPRDADRKVPPFDIGALCGLSIDDVRMKLGKPDDTEPEPSDLQINVGIDEWSNSFEKDGRELLVTFSARSRRVKDFFVSGDDFKQVTAEWQLDENLGKYRLEPVLALGNPKLITGVLIIPMERQTDGPQVSESTKTVDVRTWHDVSGKFKTEAQFGSMTAGVVTLRKADGTTIKVRLEQLSEEDQEWIEAKRRAKKR